MISTYAIDANGASYLQKNMVRINSKKNNVKTACNKLIIRSLSLLTLKNRHLSPASLTQGLSSCWSRKRSNISEGGNPLVSTYETCAVFWKRISKD